MRLLRSYHSWEFRLNGMHIPVLLNEVIDAVHPKPGMLFVDGTVGNGGHAIEILKSMQWKGIFVGIDADKSSLIVAKNRIEKMSEGSDIETIWVHDSYANIPEILEKNNLGKVNCVLLDLGFSSFQINDPMRGFSFQKDGPLDMRYDTSKGATASEIINSLGKEELAEIFWKYGDEKYSRQIAEMVFKARKRKKISTIFEFVSVIKNAVPKRYMNQKINFATRTFQALRIYTNRELENLNSILNQLPNIVCSGGCAAIITFHSLEDKLVKDEFRIFEKNGIAKLGTKKPISASRDEILSNPRSRSAKLRTIIFS